MCVDLTHLEFSQLRGLAADGRCKAFSAGADGFGPAEGVAVLVLERLSDARRLGHRVLAVVRGSAVNQDGASNGLTAPSGPAQRRLIRQAWVNAGVSGADIDVVEAHGTGTPLGDPIEAQALLATYGQAREPQRPLWLGSVKSNMGHTQAAAGLAGVIKMVEAMRRGVMPATLHVDEPSAQIDWESGAVELLASRREWPSEGRVRRAAVSSFGISGTNAHVILEEAPSAESGPAPADVAAPAVVPWVLSARSRGALTAQAVRLREFLRADPQVDAVAVAATLARRTKFEHRAVLVGADRAELESRLDTLIAGELASGVVVGEAAAEGKTVFVFPGQGSQWLGMGQQLYNDFPVFANAFDTVAQVCDASLPQPLREVLWGTDAAELDRTLYAQPGLFAVEVASCALLAAFGIHPDMVLGHSLGEITAAHIAGALSLEDAVKLVMGRAQLMAALPSGGAMIAVGASQDEVAPLLAATHASLAAVNGPDSVVISGPHDELIDVAEQLRERGYKTTELAVSHAFHSVLMEPMLDEFAEIAATIAIADPVIPVVSNVDGRAYATGYGDADYWVRHVRQTVRFADSLQTVGELDPVRVIEVGPGALTPLIRQILEAPLAVPVLRRRRNETDCFTEALASAYVVGVDVDWSVLVGGGELVDVPPYAFDRKRYWLDAPAGGDVRSFGLGGCVHPLLAAVVESPSSGEVVFTGRLGLGSHGWLKDHAVGEVVLVPGAALAEWALFAGDRVGCGVVRELVLQSPMTMPERGGVDIRVVVGAADDSDGRGVWVFSRPEDSDGSWTLHAEGTVEPDSASSVEIPASSVWPPVGAKPVSVDDFYQLCVDRGYRYGPVFQGLTAVWRGLDEVFAEVQLPEPALADADNFMVHPALLDAAMQAMGFLDLPVGEGQVLLPFAWEQIRVHAVGARHLRARLSSSGDHRVSIVLHDSSGELVAEATLTVRGISLNQLQTINNIDDSLFTIEWKPTPRSTGGPGREIEYVLKQDWRWNGDFADLRDALYDIAAELQSYLETAPPESRIVVLTQLLIHVVESDDVNPGGEAIWGLLRSVQNEYPDRITLIDTDDWNNTAWAVAAASASGEPQLAVRRGAVRVPRLVRLDRSSVVQIKDGAWRLQTAGRGTLTAENFVAAPLPVDAELGATEVRIAVRATGVNFRDVLVALGMYPDPDATIGGEGAGVVVAVGDRVSGIEVGDRVMGMFEGVGSVATADCRVVAQIPEDWSFVSAAGVPAVFLTAYYALRDLAQVQHGERVLIHAATGGVGMAAIALARLWGVEVFATASPAKWPMLRSMGLNDDHISSSRSTDFENAFMTATEGRGVDVVLNSLAGELTDASLRLMPQGGHFIELGRTDVRDPGELAEQYPGVSYQPFVLFDVSEDRLGEMLHELKALFERGDIKPVEASGWDVRRLPEVYRYLSQARHVGKTVLAIPGQLEPQGTVLITGGTGVLGGLIARHLIERYGVRHLLLVSRSGGDAPGADELVQELTALGAHVEIAACDVSDREALRDVLAKVRQQHPLIGVVHTAGVLHDGILSAMTIDKWNPVLKTKVDAAWNLHELTAGDDLALFVMFSSAAGILGNPGQANYAAANTFLDALAQYRQHRGLPGTSLAWGLWEQKTGLTEHLSDQESARMARNGFLPIASTDGRAMFDAAIECGHPLVVPARIDTAAIAASRTAPAITNAIARSRRHANNNEPEQRSKLAAQLSGHNETEQGRIILDFVKTHVAVVLGHDSAQAIPADEPFKNLGFDSLSAVEFRNRLQTATTLKIPATMVFDYPTPKALAQYLRTQITPDHHTENTQEAELTDLLIRFEEIISSTALIDSTKGMLLRRFGELDRMLRGSSAEHAADLESADDAAIFSLIDGSWEIT